MDSVEHLSPYMFRYKSTIFATKEGLTLEDIHGFQHLEVRPTDICLCTFPKSGTMWMQEILVQIVNAAYPNQVEDVSNRMRVPWLEGMSFNNVFRESHDPRMFRTHVFPDLLPKDVKAKKIKVVYVMRNPKDVLVSLYHFTQSWIQLESVKAFGDIFWDFLEDNAPGGSWFDHVLHFHREKDQMDIHFIKYEDMLMDLRGEVVKLCAFLGKDLTDEAIDHVVEMSTFKNMKTNPKANYKDLLEADKYRKPTMRKGEAGDWKNYFTVAQNEHFDKVFKERMSEFPLSFTWDLQQ